MVINYWQIVACRCNVVDSESDGASDEKDRDDGSNADGDGYNNAGGERQIWFFLFADMREGGR